MWRNFKRELNQSLRRRMRAWRRRFSPRVGEAGETVALRFLLGKGYDVVARNFRVGNGELDIIAYHGETLVFVEVKTRSHKDRYPPQLAVNKRKEEKLVRLATAFCHRYGLDLVPIRFDVIAVTMQNVLPPRVEHFVGAF
ncbi:MAG: YraN family protein [Acidobacteria bacterium]|nr:YraN family protein [Acidobacteriota bacterium]